MMTAHAMTTERIGTVLPWPHLSPWALATLVAVARHRSRQAWVRDVVIERLRGDPEKLARFGAMGHPERLPQEGLVPGLAPWRYFFHGRGCCLTHGESGESIDVDFHEPGGRADVVDAFFYETYLGSLSDPEPAEARVITLHPSLGTLRVSMVELVEHGLLLEVGGGVTLAPGAVPHEPLLLRLGAARPPHDPPSEEAIRERRAWLLARERSDTYGLSLEAFAETAPPRIDLQRVLDRALEDSPLNGRTSTALRLVTTRDQRDDCAAVWTLFCRLDGDGDVPQPWLWTECSKFLLRHGHAVDRVVPALARVGGTGVGDAMLLALEHAPTLGHVLLRKALRSSIPLNRSTAAATLAIFGGSWALDELEALLDESVDRGLTAECRAALRTLDDPRGACARWESKHGAKPPTAADGSISIDEVVIQTAGDEVLAEIARLRTRVERLVPRPS